DQMPEVLNSIPDAPNIGRITPGELKSALDRGGHIVVVDVSDRQGYATMHIPGAKNIPVDELHARALQELPDQGKVVLYCGCSEDQLSIFGVTILKTAFSGSYEGVVILAGGLNAWQAAGFPTESKALTLYNQ
ncbi:MAG: rhodanese-like domain-containing protein, partial [Blastocatellia bacterium]